MPDLLSTPRKPRRRLAEPLNDLSGREWLYWTNTIWETAYRPDATHRLRKAHGAIKPPEAMAEIVRFFSRSGETILDPFAGVGGILLGAELAGRRSIGFEVDPRWIAVWGEIRSRFRLRDGVFVDGGDGAPLGAEMRAGDCLRLIKEIPDASIDAVVTDPPYGVDHGATVFKAETHFQMADGAGEGDFGRAATLDDYMVLMAELAREAHRVLRAGRYLVLTIGDRYRDGEYVPLGVRVADVLRGEGFALKGIKIWWNRSTLRPLRPYAVGSAFVPNITHQNLLILRRR